VALTQDFVNPARRVEALHKHPVAELNAIIDVLACFNVATKGGGALRTRQQIADTMTINRPHFGMTDNSVVTYVPQQLLYFEFTKEFTKIGTAAKFKGCHELNIYPANANGRVACAFLPWREDEVTMMECPLNADYIFTGSLSGCQVYVTTGGGRTRLFHANSNHIGLGLGHPELSMRYMDSLFIRARPPANALVARLSKAHYVTGYRDLDDKNELVRVPGMISDNFVARKTQGSDNRKARTNVELHTTQAWVFGVRAPATQNWSFFYHVAGITSYERTGTLRSNVNDEWKSIIYADALPAAVNADLLT
jgi:hypothetical protein